MNPCTERPPELDPRRAACGAFTLVELLVVIVIISVLMGILLPAVQSVRMRSQMAATSAQIRSIATACYAYQADYGYFPPVGLHREPEPDLHVDIDKPAEVLWWFLTRQVSYRSDVTNFNQGHAGLEYDWDDPIIYGTQNTGPYYSPQSGQLRDYDEDGVPEIVDVWGHPLLYDTIGGEFGTGTENRPRHNRLTFDIFSVGPNGTTRQANRDYRFTRVLDGSISYEDWVEFCLGAEEVNDTTVSGGNDTAGRGGNPLTNDYTVRDQDDINNWNTQ